MRRWLCRIAAAGNKSGPENIACRHRRDRESQLSEKNRWRLRVCPADLASRPRLNQTRGFFGSRSADFWRILLGFVEALHVEEGDAHVDAADVGFLVQDACALKFAESFFKMLAVHESDAIIIFADDFCAGGFFGFRGGDGFFCALAGVGAGGVCCVCGVWGGACCCGCWPRVVSVRARIVAGRARRAERVANVDFCGAGTGFILVEKW